MGKELIYSTHKYGISRLKSIPGVKHVIHVDKGTKGNFLRVSYIAPGKGTETVDVKINGSPDELTIGDYNTLFNHFKNIINGQ